MGARCLSFFAGDSVCLEKRADPKGGAIGGQGADSPCFLSGRKGGSHRIAAGDDVGSITMFAFEIGGAFLLVLFLAALIEFDPRARERR